MHEKGGSLWKIRLREVLQREQEIHGKSQFPVVCPATRQLQVVCDPDTAVFSLSIGFISLTLMLGCVPEFLSELNKIRLINYMVYS